jgi:hypothetical protein
MKITKRDGSIIIDFEEIKSVSRNHYTTLYTQSEEGESSNIQAMLENIPNMVTIEDNNDIIQPISKEKISTVIWSLEPNKVP